MLAAVIALAAVLALSAGLSIYLAQRGFKINDRAWKEADGSHELAIRQTKLEGQYDQALAAVDILKKDGAALEKALQAAEEAYAELAAETIDDTKSPRTANVLRMALRRLERLRAVVPEMPKAPSPAPTEDREGEGAVHGADPGATVEDGSNT